MLIKENAQALSIKGRKQYMKGRREESYQQIHSDGIYFLNLLSIKIYLLQILIILLVLGNRIFKTYSKV